MSWGFPSYFPQHHFLNNPFSPSDLRELFISANFPSDLSLFLRSLLSSICPSIHLPDHHALIFVVYYVFGYIERVVLPDYYFFIILWLFCLFIFLSELQNSWVVLFTLILNSQIEENLHLYNVECCQDRGMPFHLFEISFMFLEFFMYRLTHLSLIFIVWYFIFVYVFLLLLKMGSFLLTCLQIDCCLLT